MPEESSESTIPISSMDNIISDLKVLHEKCERDIATKFDFNIKYYYDEFNRILTQLKHNCPDKFEDVEYIDIKSGLKGRIARDEIGYAEVAELHRVDAEISKVHNRILGYEYGQEGKTQTLLNLERLFNRFHQVAGQLRNRHDDRQTIDVKDEYDVQDLLHGLLKIFFDDIRPEEWTPSYAGSSSRMDFLLKLEKLVVEVKRASDSLRDKQVGEQLIIDAAKYKEHPDCKTLVCFVYDPEGKIGNPAGLENDLAKLSSSDLQVKVFICPK